MLVVMTFWTNASAYIVFIQCTSVGEKIVFEGTRVNKCNATLFATRAHLSKLCGSRPVWSQYAPMLIRSKRAGRAMT